MIWKPTKRNMGLRIVAKWNGDRKLVGPAPTADMVLRISSKIERGPAAFVRLREEPTDGVSTNNL